MNMLTVIIPAYNHENYVLECLDKAESIEIDQKRIIVIDDGSTDSTAQKVTKYITESGTADVELLTKNNSGLISSLNLGLSLTKSEFLYIIASDDIPNPKGIAQCVQQLQSNSQLRFCIGGGVNFFEGQSNETPIYSSHHNHFFRMPPQERAIEAFLNYPSPLLLQSTVFRTSALRAIDGWDPNVAWDDYPTFVKLLRTFPTEGRDFIFRPDFDVVKYRHHGSNTYKKILKQFLMVQQAIQELAPGHLKDKAIGNALAYYFLIALRQREFSTALRTLKHASWRSALHAVPTSAKLIIRQLTRIR